MHQPCSNWHLDPKPPASVGALVPLLAAQLQVRPSTNRSAAFSTLHMRSSDDWLKRDSIIRIAPVALIPFLSEILSLIHVRVVVCYRGVQPCVPTAMLIFDRDHLPRALFLIPSFHVSLADFTVRFVFNSIKNMVSSDADIAIAFGLIGAILSLVGVLVACLTLRFMMVEKYERNQRIYGDREVFHHEHTHLFSLSSDQGPRQRQLRLE
ncbi:hypothetical protein NA56DRAFT_241419 [Hyaloscypha hepaticicola]|uniref:Uncharacterized protein n=1 Tax=Hyaloscypha hepaticicola TaxID=2082293 RepID=A0A2J6PX45_9HELO|nr:hypothetical protein NA56DRAFT_241419 [Hyaloscypha hepaticicola]